MATKKPTYAPEAQYKVELAARIELLGQTFYPGADLMLRGDLLATLDPAAVAKATAVQEPEA